jgi:hypothetical protein
MLEMFLMAICVSGMSLGERSEKKIHSGNERAGLRQFTAA